MEEIPQRILGLFLENMLETLPKNHSAIIQAMGPFNGTRAITTYWPGIPMENLCL